MRYVAFVHKDPDTDYGISFPDFPGCISVGETVDAVIANGTEALAFHVSGMEADGDVVPDPRSIEEIRSDAEFAEELEGASFALVHLVRDLGSTTRINVSLDLGLLRAIDDEAKSRGQTRSAFIASAVRRELVE
ncbi:type II toxin-antitoxin system HicB family antitoxin [Devosia sp.]|uniref:type II toxin-antitoxin system HicB family antitoxin n=1 Tax=Devosia sp. TaxID=1871048 RepID=UPI0032679B38